MKTFLVALLLASPGFADSAKDEAARHMARGAAAMKAAESPTDFKEAAAEFEAAAVALPSLAAAHYNAGTAYSKAGDHAAAAKSFKLYIGAVVKEKDVEQGKTRLYEEEFLVEKAAKTDARYAGLWATAMDGKVLVMGGRRHMDWAVTSLGGGRYEIKYTQTGGKEQKMSKVFNVKIEGETISGRFQWNGYAPDGTYLCPPTDSGATGSVMENGAALFLKYQTSMKETNCGMGTFDMTLMRVN